MVVVLSFRIIFFCYNSYLAGIAFFKCLHATSVRDGVAKEVKVTDYEDFGAVPLLGCSLVSYHAWMLWLCLCSILYFGLHVWLCFIY